MCDLNLTYPPFKLNGLRTTGPRTLLLMIRENNCIKIDVREDWEWIVKDIHLDY